MLLIGLLAVSPVAAQSGGYQVTGTAAASTGGAATGATYQVQGTLGQSAVDTSAGDNYVVTGGIWPARMTAPPGPRRVYLPLALHSYPPGPGLHPWADAPDSCAAARLMVGGDTYQDDFGTPNDNDWYQFPAVAGQSYRIATSALGARADTQLFLYAAGNCGTPIAENDDILYPVDISSQIVWTAPADGVYYILVRNWDWQVYGADTGYRLQVTETPPVRQSGPAPAATAKPTPPPTPTPGGGQ